LILWRDGVVVSEVAEIEKLFGLAADEHELAEVGQRWERVFVAGQDGLGTLAGEAQGSFCRGDWAAAELGQHGRQMLVEEQGGLRIGDRHVPEMRPVVTGIQSILSGGREPIRGDQPKNHFGLKRGEIEGHLCSSFFD